MDECACEAGLCAVTQISNAANIADVRRLWFIVPTEFLQRLFANPDFAAHLLAQLHRTVDDSQTYFGGEAFARFSAYHGGVMLSDGVVTVLFTVGQDGVKLVNIGIRTATLVLLHCEDLPPHLVQTLAALFPAIVIEGRHEPHNLKWVLQLLVDWFWEHRGARKRLCMLAAS